MIKETICWNGGLPKKTGRYLIETCSGIFIAFYTSPEHMQGCRVPYFTIEDGGSYRPIPYEEILLWSKLPSGPHHINDTEEEEVEEDDNKSLAFKLLRVMTLDTYHYASDESLDSIRMLEVLRQKANLIHSHERSAEELNEIKWQFYDYQATQKLIPKGVRFDRIREDIKNYDRFYKIKWKDRDSYGK